MIQVAGVRAVLTDIEGTTGSVDFVHDVLFPYARRHLPDFLTRHHEELAPLIAAVRVAEDEDALDVAAAILVLLRWIDEDRKAPPLKALQGMIWRAGYESGELIGHVYEDAGRTLRRWRDSGMHLYVYSSGSVVAQQLLFRHSSAGDLTSLFTGFFDTAVGAKTSPESYVRIAEALTRPPAQILFLSDAVAEIKAARQAGMQAIQVVRTGPAADDSVALFDDIEIGP